MGDVEPRDGLCGAGPEYCCQCFKLKTEGSLMAIGGYNGTYQRTAEVVNTSCDFPLPEGRYGHISATTADGKTLVCGGRTSSSGEYTASCLQFNSKSKIWEQHSNLKNSFRHFPTSIALKHGLYIV